MSKYFPVNRVVVYLHIVFVVATAVAVFVAAVRGSLPTNWGPAIATGLGILSAVAGGTVAVTKFLQGSQANDQQAHELRLAKVNQQQITPGPSQPIVPQSQQNDSGQVASGGATGSTAKEVSGRPDNSTQDVQDDAEPTAQDMAVPEGLDSSQWLGARTPTSEPTSASEDTA